MLDESTLEWLGKSSACRFCNPGEECTGKPVSAESMGWEGYTYPHSECVNCRYFPQHEGDFRDAAEFEGRVAAKTARFFDIETCRMCDYRKDGCDKVKDRNGKRSRMPNEWCVLKRTRLAVEREMIAEGKGPGKKEEV